MAQEGKPTTGTQAPEHPGAKAPSRRAPAWLLDNPPPGASGLIDLDAFDVTVLDPEDPADSPEALRADLLGPSDDDGFLPLAPLPEPGGYDYSVLGPAADVARAAAEAIRCLHRRSASSWLAIGAHLLVVKASLRHGEFTAWVQADFAWSPRTARAMMRAAIQLQIMKTAEFADLAPPVLLALARAPRAVLDRVRREPAEARRALTVEGVAELCAVHQPRAKSPKSGKGKDRGPVDPPGAVAFITQVELDGLLADPERTIGTKDICDAGLELRRQLEAIWLDDFETALLRTKVTFVEIKRVLSDHSDDRVTRWRLNRIVGNAANVRKRLDAMTGIGITTSGGSLTGIWAATREAMLLLEELHPRQSTVDEYLTVLWRADAMLAPFVTD